MSTHHDLGQRLTEHYATEAPPRAPDRVLELALASVDTTPQRRTVIGLPWRTSPMLSIVARLGVTAVAIVAITAVGLALLRPTSDGPGAATSPSTAPGPSPSPGFARFDSPRHGVSIDYPAGWLTRPATEPWTIGKPGFDSPAADVLFDPALGEGLYIAIASRPLGGAETSASDMLSAGSDGCGGGGGSFHVDGASAFDWHCGGGSSTVGIVTDTRGYVIKLVVSEAIPGLGQTYNGDWLDELLTTVDLRPEDAVDR